VRICSKRLLLIYLTSFEYRFSLKKLLDFSRKAHENCRLAYCDELFRMNAIFCTEIHSTNLDRSLESWNSCLKEKIWVVGLRAFRGAHLQCTPINPKSIWTTTHYIKFSMATMIFSNICMQRNGHVMCMRVWFVHICCSSILACKSILNRIDNYFHEHGAVKE
jgi:hypothetical protein